MQKKTDLKKENSFEFAQNKFIQYLEQKGYKKTPERFEILRLVCLQKKHFDVQLLFNEIKQLKYPISRATIYNTLNLLLECRLIQKQILGSKIKYERTFKPSCNYLVCTKCGLSKEFKDEYINRFIQNKALRGFAPSHHSLYIYGLCNSCKKIKEKKNETVTEIKTKPKR